MTHCAGKFRVFLNGRWVTFTDYNEAVRAEAEALKPKNPSGFNMVLTSGPRMVRRDAGRPRS